MPQHYSDPTRANDPHALPNVETFQMDVYDVYCEDCDDTYRAYVHRVPDAGRACCPECARQMPHCGHDFVTHVLGAGESWFYQFCFPGCLPDSDPIGPFATEAEALDDARNGIADDAENYLDN